MSEQLLLALVFCSACSKEPMLMAILAQEQAQSTEDCSSFVHSELWSLMAVVMVGGHNRPMLKGRLLCSAHDLPPIRLLLLLLLLPAMVHPVDGLLVPPRSGSRSLMLGMLPRAMFQEPKLHRPGS